MNLLTAEEIDRKLRDLNEWRLTPDGIQKRFEMESFLSVMNLVNRVADLAEEANHHPEILINYNKVTFTLTTHDAGGVTEKDFDLAQRIEAIAP
jgi:4a-hydroxytetrahydrobiopterin dehydratase